MKRLAILLASACLIAACTEDRSSLLKVYNWGDYIDEELLPEFEQWYFEQTGEEVHVIYQTFDINETMLSKIEKGHEDYDLVCPSDYIIERMLREGLLIPLDKDFGQTPNYIDSNVAPFIKTLFDKVDGQGKNANDYIVGYMWGTTGILYNEKYVSEEDTHTWNILKNDKYIHKIFIKDAARDVYGPILMYLKKDEIARGDMTLDDLMYDSTDESLDAVEQYMSEMRSRIAGWEADFGKEQMTQERGWINLTWSGDAVWAIEEAAEVDVPLRYTVPDEGSNVWFDGWVIPKYAGNVKAAGYFVNFLCRPDVAIRNMDVIGYVSTIGTPEVLEAMSDEEAYDPVDVSYFFGEDATAEHLNPTQYPDRSIVERCTMMHDWGNDSAKLIAMWSRVKGNQLSWWTLFVIFTTLACIIFAKVRKMIKLRLKTKRNLSKVERRK